LPPGLEKNGRAPSYKKIAMAILKNDLNFHSIGFAKEESELTKMLMQENAQNGKNQLTLL